jgi:hypothetical protein
VEARIEQCSRGHHQVLIDGLAGQTRIASNTASPAASS